MLPRVYVPGGRRRRALDKGCISPHWCPKLRSSLIGCPAGVDSHGVFADISGILTTKARPRRRWPGTVAAHECVTSMRPMAADRKNVNRPRAVRYFDDESY